MPSGVVKWFDVKKGFGFIQGPDGEKDVFVHYSSIEGEGFRSLKDGEQVEYELSDSDRGPQARNVCRIQSEPAQEEGAEPDSAPPGDPPPSDSSQPQDSSPPPDSTPL
jgi:CspA family cold shock protein